MTTPHFLPTPTRVHTSLSARLLCASIHAALLGMAGLAQAQSQSSPSPSPTSEQLGEITVTARDPNARVQAATVTVLGAAELARRNATDMASVARYEALVSVPASASGGAGASVWDSSGASSFNIRGVEGNRIALDIDGIALPDAAAKPDATNMNAFGIGRDYFDPALFREVRIGSGTSAAGAGTPGLGGSVAFVTKAPEDYLAGRDQYIAYALGYSGANAARSHTLTGATRAGAVEVLAVMVHRSGEALENKGSLAPNADDWTSDALLAKFNWAPAAGHKLGLTVDVYRRDNARKLVSKVAALYPDGTTQDSKTQRDRVSLTHKLVQPGGALFDTLDSRVYYQNAQVEDRTFARYLVGGQPVLRDIQTGYFNMSTGAASDATLQVGANTLLAYGVAYERIATSRPWVENRLVLASGATQVTTKDRMPDMDTDKASAWLRADIGFKLGSLDATLTPGLRTEYRKLTPTSTDGYLVAVKGATSEITEESATYTAPSLSLSIALTPATSVYASVKRGVRLPSASERTGSYDSFSYTGTGNGYAVIGNPALSKETSTAFETGIKANPAKGVNVSASLFRTNYTNLIDYVLQANDPVKYPTITQGLYRPDNFGSARTWGGEASVSAQLGQWHAALAGVSLQAAAGIARGESTNRLTGKQGELASTLPRKASMTLAYDAPADAYGVALSAFATAGKRPAADVIAGVSTARFRIPGATVADLTAYWRLGAHATLNLGVYNLGDKRYWDYASARSLAAGTTAAALAEIERNTRAGRNLAATLTFQY